MVSGVRTESFGAHLQTLLRCLLNGIHNTPDTHKREPDQLCNALIWSWLPLRTWSLTPLMPNPALAGLQCWLAEFNAYGSRAEQAGTHALTRQVNVDRGWIDIQINICLRHTNKCNQGRHDDKATYAQRAIAIANDGIDTDGCV